MKRMRLAMCVAVFALIGGIAISEDLDVRALQAKLAAQEARLNDLQAKMNAKGKGGDAEGVVSMRKNAVVTIGGTVNTRYFYRDGEVKSMLDVVPQDAALPGTRGRYVYDTANRISRDDFRYSDLTISDAKLDVKIDVNDYFDAYLKMDLHDGAGRADVSGIAQNYWIRWKNLCNSGFGVLIGRDAIKFGDSQPIGALDSWVKDVAGPTADLSSRSRYVNPTQSAADPLIPGGNFQQRGEGMFAYGSMLPAHTMTNWTRTTQITPYWESQDGKIKAELSFIQSIDRQNGRSAGAWYQYTDTGGVTNYRSINYGLGSGTFRLTWKPIDGLKLTASAQNLYTNSDGKWAWDGVLGNSGNRGAGAGNNNRYGVPTTSNNSAVNFAFQYRPCFANRLNVWGQWTHGWNEEWIKNQDSDVVQVGAMYDFTEKFTLFAMGEWLRTKNDYAAIWHKGEGWNVYTGVRYKVGYGVNLEAGWRHEEIDYKDFRGVKHTSWKADTIYGHVGFDF